MSDEERPAKLPSFSEIFGSSNNDSLGGLHSSFGSVSPLNASSTSLPTSFRGQPDLTAFSLKDEGSQRAQSIGSSGSTEYSGNRYPPSFGSNASGSSSSSIPKLPPLAPPRTSSLRKQTSRGERKLPSIQTAMHHISGSSSLMSLANQQTPRAGLPPLSAHEPLQQTAYLSGQIPYSPFPSASSLGNPSPRRNAPESLFHDYEETIDVKPARRYSYDANTPNTHQQPSLLQQMAQNDSSRYRERSQTSLYPSSMHTRSSEGSSARSSFSSDFARSSISSNSSLAYDYGPPRTGYRQQVAGSDRMHSQFGYAQSDISSIRSNSPPTSPYLAQERTTLFAPVSAPYFDRKPSSSSSSYNRLPVSSHATLAAQVSSTESQTMPPIRQPQQDYPFAYGNTYGESFVEHRPPITAGTMPRTVPAPMPSPARLLQQQPPQLLASMPENQVFPSPAQPPPGFRPAVINPFARHSAASLNGKYLCEFCNKRFNRPSSLKIHMHSHSGEKPYPCHLCGRAFSVNSNLRRHLRVHDKYAAMDNMNAAGDTEMGDAEEEPYIGSEDD